jgi:predicted MFS family arabinose efflux permease
MISGFGSFAGALALVTALGKQVYDLSHRELDLGLLGLAEFAPAALLVLVTGVIADRWDRRWVACGATFGQAAAALLITWYVSTEPTAVGPIFAIIVGFGVARAFAAPALRSLPADIVSGPRLPWLVARWSVSFQLALIAGPVIGGMLYVIDPTVPFLAAAALFAIAALAFLSVRPGPDAPMPPAIEATAERPRLHDALEGLRIIRRRPVLLGAISLDLFAVLFGGAVALLPAIAEDRLGVGAVGFGWLRAAAGIGAAAVTFFLVARPLHRRIGPILLGCVAIFGAGTVVLGATRSYAVAFLALVALSGADALSVYIRATLVPLVTPAEARGRVLAVEMVFIGASNELGAFESGVAGQLLGPAPAVMLGGVATLAVAGGWWFLFPSLRGLDRFPNLEAEGASAGA